MTDEPTILPPARPARPMMIRGLTPSLPERGKIKIGRKGKLVTSRSGTEFQPPQKLDYFVVTTMEREPAPDNNFKRDEAAHRQLGDAPKELPVRLLYDDPTLNFPTRYANYIGRKLWCTGDGDRAQRLHKDGTYEDIRCPCPLSDPSYVPQKGDLPRCKMNGSLSVLLEGTATVGGVWKFRTTSYNSIVGILSSLAFLRQITGGVLANIPLRLYVRPKQGSAPDGSPVTVYVVGIEFAGDIAHLQNVGHQIALDRAKTHVSIANIEDEARRLLLAPPASVPLPGDTTDDIVEEFYPEQVTDPTPVPPRPRREDFAEPDAPHTGRLSRFEAAHTPEPEPYDPDTGEILRDTDPEPGEPPAPPPHPGTVAAESAPPSPLAAKKPDWLAWERWASDRLRELPQADIAGFLTEHGKEFDFIAENRKPSWQAIEAIIEGRKAT